MYCNMKTFALLNFNHVVRNLFVLVFYYDRQLMIYDAIWLEYAFTKGKVN